jgi:hypothetical protein
MGATLDAIAEERATVLKVCSQMPDSMWAKDSGCPGWLVQDLVSHMACSCWLAVDPSTLPDPGGLPAKRPSDLYVESGRSMTPAEVVADYESVSSRGLGVLAAVEDHDIEIPIGDVGTYPAAVVPTTLCSSPSSGFGTTCLLRMGRCSQIRRPSTSSGLPHA